MKKIAIKPHKTRGKEVISILEKNGGVNCNEYSGTEHIEHPVAYYVAVDHYIVFSNITFLEQRGYKIYTLEEWEDECKSDEMIEGLVEESDDFEKMYMESEKRYEEEYSKGEYCHEQSFKWGFQEGYDYAHENEKLEINLKNGYEFKDDNGNVINTQKIIMEKKKVEYPKTYEECSLITGYEDRIPLKIIGEFTRLINARNAYWKLYGEEMGLGKPWEPSDSDYITGRYCIFVHRGNIICDTPAQDCVLTFPTPEMRDAFKKNFDPEIEICKELL